MGRFNDLINGNKPVLVDFFATWCGPCKMMHPILEDLKKRMGKQIHVLKLDVDASENRELSVGYQIQSVPTLMVFKEGKILWRQSGVATAAQLESVLEKYL